MNYNGAAVRNFCAYNKLKITNSFYRHNDITNLPVRQEVPGQ